MNVPVRVYLVPHVLLPSLVDTKVAEHVKRTTQGKLAAATQVQSAQYLKPLFKLLRSRVRLTCPFSALEVLFFLRLLTRRSLIVPSG